MAINNYPKEKTRIFYIDRYSGKKEYGIVCSLEEASKLWSRQDILDRKDVVCIFWDDDKDRFPRYTAFSRIFIDKINNKPTWL